MKALFARKPIADDAMIGDLPIEAEHSRGLQRTLGAGDLVMLAPLWLQMVHLLGSNMLWIAMVWKALESSDS